MIEQQPKVVIPKPVIKCPGGKTQMLQQLYSKLPDMQEIELYVEPFVGGGALLIDLIKNNKDLRFYINDLNKDIYLIYKHVSNNALCSDLIRELDLLQKELPTEDLKVEQFYYDVRDKFNLELTSESLRLARFIYLNKSCFNGLIRYNSKGGFNSPFGDNSFKSFNIHNLKAIYRLFSSKTNKNKPRSLGIENKDFSSFLWGLMYSYKDISPAKTVIYLDPPYVPKTETENFSEYTSIGFNLGDHHRMARDVVELDRLGYKVIVSNSNTDLVKKMYKKFNISEAYARRNINSVSNKRSVKARELIITNY